MAKDIESDLLMALSVLRRHDMTSLGYVTALAADLGHSRSAVRNHLKVMERMGWVTARLHETVEGAVIWELTAKGRKVAVWRNATEARRG